MKLPNSFKLLAGNFVILSVLTPLSWAQEPSPSGQEPSTQAAAGDNSSDKKLGMKEKRLIKNLEESEIPFHKKTFADMTGGKLEIEVDWSQFGGDDAGLLNLNGYVLQQFTDTLVHLAADDVGKESLRDQIQKLKVVRVDSADDKSVTLEEGVLVLKVKPSDGWDGVIRNSTIQEYLLQNL